MTTPSSYCLIALTRGQFAKVSPHRLPELCQFRWSLMGKYAARRTVGKSIYMHRQILRLEDGDSHVGDHINRDTLDNTDENLRIATKYQNSLNKSGKNADGVRTKGILFNKKRNKLISCITLNGVKTYLGEFPNTRIGEIMAMRCYDFAAWRHFRDFACLNFPRQVYLETYARLTICSGGAEMTEELNQAIEGAPISSQKPKRPYTRRQSAQPNANVALLEADLVPLVRQRMELVKQVVVSRTTANQANAELQHLQSSLAQLEETIQYQQQVIAQMKGVPFVPFASAQQSPSTATTPPRFADYPQQPPSPYYAPTIPYPPSTAGIGSFPAQNRGLHADATERTESAVDFMTPELRAEFEGRR